jgi:excisionase family DNA binding protein
LLPSPALRPQRATRFFTVSEVARALGVCAATVYKLCATGASQHVRVVNSIRVAEECLRLFVDPRPPLPIESKQTPTSKIHTTDLATPDAGPLRPSAKVEELAKPLRR